jgi:iron complex transport system permease protein
VLGGAALLLAADLGARTVVDYADLPIGMFTALVGGPFFFWLLRRSNRSAGGWS